MNERFLDLIEGLDDALETLKACKPMRFGELPTGMPMSGVYLFSEGQTHFYVGRSNRLRGRYFLHCRPGSRQNQASFAYKVAREALGLGKSSYGAGEQSRTGLAATADFIDAFTGAKKRIRQMDYRFAVEEDQTRQALLEAYCAIALETPYNDFDTH